MAFMVFKRPLNLEEYNSLKAAFVEAEAEIERLRAALQSLADAPLPKWACETAKEALRPR